MYNMCIELEDDIFNMIELFARDKTLQRIFVSDRYCWSSLFSECRESLENVRDENFASVWWLWSNPRAHRG